MVFNIYGERIKSSNSQTNLNNELKLDYVLETKLNKPTVNI